MPTRRMASSEQQNWKKRWTSLAEKYSEYVGYLHLLVSLLRQEDLT